MKDQRQVYKKGIFLYFFALKDTDPVKLERKEFIFNLCIHIHYILVLLKYTGLPYTLTKIIIPPF